MTHSQKTARSYRSMQADGQAELDTLQRERRTRMAGWDAQWHAAGDWCAEHLPDLIDKRTNAPCGFAVASALSLRSELGRAPSPGQVRQARAAWLRRLGVKGDT